MEEYISTHDMGLSEDAQRSIVCVQAIEDAKFLLLRTTGEDADETVSQLILADFPENGIDPPKYDVMLELKGWLTTFWVTPDSTIFVGTWDGVILIIDGNDMAEYPVAGRAISRFRGQDSENVVAVSMGGEVLRWDGRDWTELDASIQSPLLDIVMQANASFTVVGENGTCKTYQTAVWRSLELPTNVQVNAAKMHNGHIHVGGSKGYSARLNGEEITELSGADTNLHEFAAFQGHLYAAASEGGVLRLDDEWSVVRKECAGFALAASERMLIVAGGNEVAVLSGSNWRDYEVPGDLE